jgi:hypothetical protein
MVVVLDFSSSAAQRYPGKKVERLLAGATSHCSCYGEARETVYHVKDTTSIRVMEGFERGRFPVWRDLHGFT